MNRVVLSGFLTKDVKLATSQNNVAVAQFDIAVRRNYKNENGEYETDFIHIVAWRGLAETVEKFCKKGSRVSICGRLQTRSYETADGSKRYITEVVADDVEFLSTKEKVEKTSEDTKEPVAKFTPIYDDVLPF